LSIEAATADATADADRATAVASTPTITKRTTAAAESSSAVASTKAASSTAKASTTAVAAHHGVGKPVLADLEHAALPVVTVELLDRIAGVVRALEDYDARPLRSSIGPQMDIGSDDRASADYSKTRQQIVGPLPDEG
jgi:hypothetical protein